MAIFVSDSFTGTDGTDLAARTGETGATWTEHPSYTSGGTVLQSGRIRAISTAATSYFASGTPASADYSASGDVYVASNTTGATFGIAIRLATAANTMLTLRYSVTGATWQLYKFVNGTATQLGSNVTQTLTVGSTYPVTLSATGTTIVGTADGVEIFNLTDGAVTEAGRVGFRAAIGSATTGIHFDNLVAEEATGGTTYTEPLTTLADAYATVTDISTYIEAAQAIITAGVSVADTVTMLESILTTAQTAATVLDTALAMDPLNTTISAQATVTDEQISDAAENLLTAATSFSSVIDLQLMVDNLTVVAQSTASLTEIGAYLEQLAAAATGQASVTDVLVGSFVGRYIFYNQCQPRYFSAQSAPRYYGNQCNPRGRV